jgi:hypothetical protein
VVGFTDLPSRFGGQATNFYANNLVNLLEDMCAKGTLAERGEKKRPFSSLFRCLSRVCLGKMIVFIYKWLKKGGVCFSQA